MIVEKLYSQENTNEEIKEINESDLSAVKLLTEKYGATEIFDELNEKRKDRDFNTQYHPTVSSQFDRTGGSTVRGLSGKLQSIPSFAITVLISPALAALAGVGALSHRIRQRWEDKQSWRNRLMPGFWADNLANPGNYSIPHRAVSGTGKVIKGTAAALLGASLGPFAWPKLKEKYSEMKENSPSWLKKLIGIGTAAGIGAAAASTNAKKDSSVNSSIYYDDSLIMTPEEVKNIDFKEYYVTLSNNEVLRVKADNEQNAKLLGKEIVALSLLAGGWYERLNNEIKRGNYRRFEFFFDDGEMCYAAGKDQKEALKAAKQYRHELCELMNNSDGDLMKVDPLIIPHIYGSTHPKKGEEIPLPDKNNMSVSLTAPEKKETKSKKIKYPAYAYGDMKDYSVKFMNCKIHFPAFDAREVDDMVKQFYSNYAKPVLSAIENVATRRTCQQFKVTMGDKDLYYIYAIDYATAIDWSMKLHTAKLNAALAVMRMNKNDYILEDFLDEFGDLIKKPVCKTIPVKDWKPFKFDHKVYITKNPSADDETKDVYQAYTM